MGRTSVKQNKNIYFETREKLNISREKASELLESITPERIEKIENEKCIPHPDEILTMSEKYKKPSLCNYYCSTQCPIGQKYVPHVTDENLSEIILKMLASLNTINQKKERLIEIASDGKISDTELDDFLLIQNELERVSVSVEALQLWAEQMIANGLINIKK